jgi:hypothetical protein
MRTPRIIAAVVAVLALAALAPLTATAKPKRLPGVEARADPLAPSGKTPIVILEVHNTHNRWLYWLSAKRVSGSEPYCNPQLGGFMPRRAKGRTLVFDPRPDFFWTRPYDVETYYDMYRPCKGTYLGYLKVKAPGRRAQTVRRFELSVPSLELTYRRR